MLNQILIFDVLKVMILGGDTNKDVSAEAIQQNELAFGTFGKNLITEVVKEFIPIDNC